MSAILKTPILLAGPTASGKSVIAARLAHLLDGEIVGADARQIYDALPILTATPSPEILAAIRHHLVACLPPEREISAHEFAEMARVAIADIQARGRRAIIVGGTGLYIQALVFGLAPAPPPSPEIRNRLARMSLPELVAELRAAAPDWAAVVDLANRRRVERALERAALGQKSPPPPTWPPSKASGLFAFLLTCSRPTLNQRIELRAKEMLRGGAIREVAAFGERPLARPPIGFADIRRHLSGEISAGDCLARLCAATRQYAKRQMTWFNAQPWLNRLDLDRLNAAGLDPAAAIVEKIL